MRLRIRGPSGQSTTSLDDNSTIETLHKTIEAQTSLTHFDVKYGYPPKLLALDHYPPQKKLADLEVSLDGEQLIISPIVSPAVTRSSDVKTAVQSHDQVVPQSAGSSRAPTQESATKLASTRSTDQNRRSPLSLSRKNPYEMSDPPEVHLSSLGGILLLRVMPDDNSCLFRAIATAVMSGLDTMTELRSMVAQTIQANSGKYTKVILDNKDPDDYCRWIQTEDAWGGQIELDILSQQFDIEICSIDVQSLRIDRYNETAPNRCVLVYSGIHYDTIALSFAGLPPEEDVKIFDPAIKEEVLSGALKLCKELQKQHYYTDTAGFKIKCNDCGTLCVGEKGAQEHAMKTGHYNFGEAA